jgi:hypothetical protein
MKEKRIARRQTLQWTAQAVDLKLAPIAPCKVSNISDTGAKLTFEECTETPDAFVLMLVQSGSVQRRCIVRWRSGNDIGVEFVPQR